LEVYSKGNRSEDKWFCEMNLDDPSRATCSQPEQAEGIDDDTAQVPFRLFDTRSLQLPETSLPSRSTWVATVEKAFDLCRVVCCVEYFILNIARPLHGPVDIVYVITRRHILRKLPT
jgi:hypothetical protein